MIVDAEGLALVATVPVRVTLVTHLPDERFCGCYDKQAFGAGGRFVLGYGVDLRERQLGPEEAAKLSRRSCDAPASWT